MLFRKWGCLVGPENSIFRKLKSVDPKNVPLTTEMLLHFYFTFKGFPENERERERARARRRSSGIASSSSSPRSRSTARSRRRSQSREEGEIAIRRDRDLGSLRAVIAISMGLFLSVVAVCWRKTHGVDNNGNTLFRVQSFSVKDLGGSGFVHFCSRGDWFNYSVLFYQTNVLIKFSVAMRRSLLSVFFFLLLLFLFFFIMPTILTSTKFAYIHL